MEECYIRSPSVLRLTRLSRCGMWNFLRDTGGISSTHTFFTIFLLINFYLKWNIETYLVNQINNVLNKIIQQSLHCRTCSSLLLRLPHSPPPHIALTRLACHSTAVFRYLLLTVLSFKFLCAHPSYRQRFLNTRWAFKLTPYGYEPPVTDASKANRQYTENVRLQCDIWKKPYKQETSYDLISSNNDGHLVTSTPLHYTSPSYTSLHFTTLHQATPHSTSLHFTKLHLTPLHYTSPSYTSPHILHFTKLHLTPLH
jgi:hypothetical protein